MPLVRDYRNYSYAQPRIERCGRFIGRASYWRLYSIENILRVVVHSVLSAQIGAAWWNSAVSPKVAKDVADTRKSYATNPHHTSPGVHDIHYIYLSTLTNIIRQNSNQFLPVIPDIHQWVLDLEGIRIPRNLVGHMNFPHLADRQRIDNLHSRMSNLVLQVGGAGITIQIPR